MNIRVLITVLTLLLTSTTCPGEGEAKPENSNENNEADLRWLSLLGHDNYLAPNHVLKLLRVLGSEWKLVESKTNHVKFIELLKNLTDHEHVDCKNENAIDLSKLDELWKKSPNIDRFIKHYKKIYMDDCDWWRWTPEKKLSEPVLNQFTLEDLADEEGLDIGLKQTFQAVRYVGANPPMLVKTEFVEYLQQLTNATTCTGIDCCTKPYKYLPVKDGNNSTNLLRYHAVFHFRPWIICYRFIRSKLVRPEGGDIESIPDLEWSNSELFHREKRQLVRSLAEFIEMNSLQYKKRPTTHGKVYDILRTLYRVFAEPCYYITRNISLPWTIYIRQYKSVGSKSFGVLDLLNRGSCKKLNPVISEVRDDFKNQDPIAYEQFEDRIYHW